EHARAVDGRVLLLDELTRAAGSASDPGPAPGAPAVINFTSGSTGTPKGVVRDHASLVCAAFTAAHGSLIEPDDVVAFTGSFSFIGAYRVSLGAFVAGAELCMHDRRVGGRELAEWISYRRISVLTSSRRCCGPSPRPRLRSRSVSFGSPTNPTTPHS